MLYITKRWLYILIDTTPESTDPNTWLSNSCLKNIFFYIEKLRLPDRNVNIYLCSYFCLYDTNRKLSYQQKTVISTENYHINRKLSYQQKTNRKLSYQQFPNIHNSHKQLSLVLCIVCKLNPWVGREYNVICMCHTKPCMLTDKWKQKSLLKEKAFSW